MGRKRVLKISKSAMLKCPNCENKSRIAVKEGVYFFGCKKCKDKISTPPARCCVLCAYSNKKCPSEIKRIAKAEGLKIKEQIALPIQIH